MDEARAIRRRRVVAGQLARPRAHVQPALVAVVYVAVQDKRVNRGHVANLVVRVCISRRLHLLAVRAGGEVEPLFGQDDMPRSALEQEPLLRQERG